GLPEMPGPAARPPAALAPLLAGAARITRSGRRLEAAGRRRARRIAAIARPLRHVLDGPQAAAVALPGELTVVSTNSEIGNWKLEIGNSKPEANVSSDSATRFPISGSRSRISDFGFRISVFLILVSGCTWDQLDPYHFFTPPPAPPPPADKLV